MSNPSPFEAPVPAATPAIGQNAAIGAPPKFVEPYVQPGRTLLVALVWLTGAFGVLMVLVMMYSMTAEPDFGLAPGTVTASALSVGYALIPLPWLLWLYWWIDRVEPEPFRYKAAAFVWGAVVAVLLALIFSGLFTWAGASETVRLAVVAPFVEEATKGLFLLVIMLRARKIIHGVIDGMILAGLVAVGFAAVENVVYYLAAYFELPEGLGVTGAEATTATFVIRGVFSPLGHPLFTTCIGVGIGLAVLQKSWLNRIVLVVGGYLGSVAFHAMWNGSAVLGGGTGFVIVYLIMALMLVGLLVAIILMRIREMKSMRSTLIQLSEMGWLHPAEVGHLLKFSRRRQARAYASKYGPHAAKAMKEYQKLATEAAFLHQLTVTGRSDVFSSRQAQAVLEHMWTLRPWLGFPPALPPQQW